MAPSIVICNLLAAGARFMFLVVDEVFDTLHNHSNMIAANTNSSYSTRLLETISGTSLLRCKRYCHLKD